MDVERFPWTITLAFFDVVTEVCLRTAGDVRDARFFYGSYETAAGPEPDVRVQLSARRTGLGFFESLLAKDRIPKRIDVQYRDGLGTWSRSTSFEFDQWSGRASPLPPFEHPYLWSKLATHGGACALTADGRGVLLLGANYVGKTSVLVELCRSRGWGFVSDSLVVLDAVQAEALSYVAPLGFRRENRARHIHELSAGDTRTTCNPITGPVSLARPERFFPVDPGRRTRVRRAVLLVRSDSGRSKVHRVPMPDLKWFGGVGAQELRRMLPAELEVLVVPGAAGPGDVADLVEGVCRD